MVKPRYMLNVFNVFNTVLRMMLARGWRFASGKGGKSRAGHKGGKGDTGLHLPPPPSSSSSSSSSPQAGPVVAACGATTTDWIRDPQSSLGGRTGEMPAVTQAVTQRDACDARSRSD